jgi:hypothetical protein
MNRNSSLKRKAPKNTGPDQKTRGLVLARDDFQCVACGKTVGGAFTWWSLQHRKARGVGGDNNPVNLIALCGSATSEGCHRRCEDRDPDMRACGYWVESWENPALVPVLYFSQGIRAFLTAEGGLLFDGYLPQGGAA